MGELIFLGILAVVSVYFFILTGDFRISPLDKSGGAAVWPRLVLGFMLLFIVVRAIQILVRKENDHFVFLELFKGIRLFFLASFVAYIALFKFLGYYIATIAFLAATVNVFYKYTKGNFGSKKHIIIRNLIIIVFVTLMDFFFSDVLHIMLPSGTIFNIF